MQKTKFELTSFHLHIIAMALMLGDHLWATVVPGNDWLTCLGRIAFPIFAFMVAEGFFYTKNIKKYAERLFLFALISEVPFDLVLFGKPFVIFHQNVLWTFLIAIGVMWINEKAKDKSLPIKIFYGGASLLLGYFLGTLLMTDYNGAGVLMVLVFYFFRKKNMLNFILQFICLLYINTELISGFYYEVEIFGFSFEFIRQNFALFALLPIWLYSGKQGLYNNTIKNMYYWFYPIHLLALWIMMEAIAFFA